MVRVQGDPELPRAAIRDAGFDLEAAAVRVNEVIAYSPGRDEGALDDFARTTGADAAELLDAAEVEALEGFF